MVKIEILSVRNPQWANEDRTAIDCLVRTNTLQHEVPFTASIKDPEVHGREIFLKCLAGDFGVVEAMSPKHQQQLLSQTEPPTDDYYLESFLVVANKENRCGSLRSVVIVWGSLLDNLLDQILEAELSRSALTSGAVGKKPPQNLATRIKLALELGLIDRKEADRCNHIRKIRNAAAHEWELSISTKGVLESLRALYKADHSRMLIFHEELQFLVQQVYSASCAMLVMKLINLLSQKTGR